MRKAFTLIELLIVVAIIAILATIAVPNFLEAQIRSKISRSMADMKSIETAMMSYLVDNNNYPIFASPNGLYLGFLMVQGGDGTTFQGGMRGYAGSLLTTPIAYLTSIPMDVFNTTLFAPPGPQPELKAHAVSVVAEIQPPGANNAQMIAWFREMRIILGDLFPETLDWAIESAGPDLRWWDLGYNGQRNPGGFIYDPTNGTVSEGQLVLSDRGWISPRK